MAQIRAALVRIVWRRHRLRTALSVDQCNDSIQADLVGPFRMFAGLFDTSWPVSGITYPAGFEIRTKSAFSNGSSVIWAIGQWLPAEAGTTVTVAFVIEPILWFTAVGILGVAVWLTVLHSWLAIALWLFAFVTGTSLVLEGRAERNRLLGFLVTRLGATDA
jgi:hypothetical protein